MPAIGPRSEWLPRPHLSHFLTNKSMPAIGPRSE